MGEKNFNKENGKIKHLIKSLSENINGKRLNTSLKLYSNHHFQIANSKPQALNIYHINGCLKQNYLWNSLECKQLIK